MTIGCFLGVRAAWPRPAEAEGLLASITACLEKQALPPYREPEQLPGPYFAGLFGRSALDHHGSASLAALTDLARERRQPDTQLALLRTSRHGAIYLPLELPAPLTLSLRLPIAPGSRKGSGPTLSLGLGSAPRLLSELRALAHQLLIPLSKGELSDETAARINALLPLYPGDRAAQDPHLAEELRPAWLLLHEGARLACQQKVAMVLV